MTNRRPPLPPSGDPTALFDRPTFDDVDVDGGADGDDGEDSAGDGGGDSPFDVEGGARPETSGFDDDDELTDPGLIPAHLADEPAPTRAQAATQRLSLDVLDDLDDLDALAISLPDANVEEHIVSDLDGDVAASGAPTAIMQLPPEMLAHNIATDGSSTPPPSDDDGSSGEDVVAFRRWSAGPAASTPPLPPPPSQGPPPAPPAPPVLGGAAPAPAAAPPVGPASLASAATLQRAMAPTMPSPVKRLVDEALKAVTAAQTCLDDEGPTSTQRAQAQLSRAVAALTRLGEDLG